MLAPGARGPAVQLRVRRTDARATRARSARSARVARAGRRPRPTRCGPTAEQPDTPGWLVRAVPNKYPLLEPGEPAPRDDPLERAAAATRSCSSPAPATGAPRGDRPRPRARRLDGRARPGAVRARASRRWRDALARAPRGRLRPPDGERGPGRGRLARAHPRPALRARRSCPALVARERERFTAHNTRTMGGCLLCDLLQEEVPAPRARRRRRRPRGAAGPVRVAHAPTSCSSCRAGTTRSFADGRRQLRAAAARGAGEARASASAASPPLNLWLRTRAQGRRALPLAHRHPAAADPAGRASSSGTGAGGQHLPARAGRRRSCGLVEACCAGAGRARSSHRARRRGACAR